MGALHTATASTLGHIHLRGGQHSCVGALVGRKKAPEGTAQRRAPPKMESRAAQPTSGALMPRWCSTVRGRRRHPTRCNTMGRGHTLLWLRANNWRNASMATTTSTRRPGKLCAAHASTWGTSTRTSPATMAMHLLICKPKRTNVHSNMPHRCCCHSSAQREGGSTPKLLPFA